MKKDKAQGSRLVTAANDDEIVSDPVVIDAALIRIAAAIGRHIAREHINARKAANDNEVAQKNPRAPKH